MNGELLRLASALNERRLAVGADVDTGVYGLAVPAAVVVDLLTAIDALTGAVVEAINEGEL